MLACKKNNCLRARVRVCTHAFKEAPACLPAWPYRLLLWCALIVGTHVAVIASPYFRHYQVGWGATRHGA